MAAIVYDFRRQITGRGLVEIPGPVHATGPHRLWAYVREGSSQNSILVYNDGTCVERQQFTTEDLLDPNVHTFIRGGTDFRCEGTGWLHEALLAAGYGCQYAVEDIYVGSDQYTDEYPQTEDSL